MAQFDATGGTVVQCGKQSTDTYTLGAINLSVSHCVTSTTYGRVYTATALTLPARKVSAMSSLAMDRRSCCKWHREGNEDITSVSIALDGVWPCFYHRSAGAYSVVEAYKLFQLMDEGGPSPACCLLHWLMRAHC